MSEQLLSSDPSAGLLSTDPAAGLLATGPHPEARMGADPFGPHAGQTDETRPVTLGDLIEDPQQSIARIGRILKTDLSDPKLWVAAALSYFGPKAIPYVVPAVGQAVRSTLGASAAVGRGVVRGTAAVGDVVSPDVVGILSPRLGKALETAQRMRTALPTPTSETPPAPAPAEAVPTGAVRPSELTPEELFARVRAAQQRPAPAAAPPPALRTGPPTPGSVTPPTPLTSLAELVTPGASRPAAPAPPAAAAPPESAPTPPAPSARWSPQRVANEVGLAARRAKVKLSADQYQAAEALVRQGQTPASAVTTVGPPKLKLAAAEMKLYTDLRRRGTSHSDAVAVIESQRELAARLGTPTSEQVRQSVAERNATGRWPE